MKVGSSPGTGIANLGGIASLNERYASVHANDTYGQEVKEFQSFGEANNGFAISLMELHPSTVVQFEGPDLSHVGASPWASRAYADGASVEAKQPSSLEYGSLRLMKIAASTEWRGSIQADGTSGAADSVARQLQYTKDLEAARQEIGAVFQQYGIDQKTVSQLGFDQKPDGSIAVSNHPLAPQIEAAVNADKELADLISFSFGFNGRANVTA
jgi:hypothetical protein